MIALLYKEKIIILFCEEKKQNMKEVAQLDVTDSKKLILSIGPFRGAERVDLRQYVKVKDEFIPTRRGINFDSEWIDGFLKMVKKLENV